MQKEDERLMTRLEVERCFGIPKRYLEISSGKDNGPPIIRVGRLVRYAPEDIRAWIKANRSER